MRQTADYHGLRGLFEDFHGVKMLATTFAAHPQRKGTGPLDFVHTRINVFLKIMEAYKPVNEDVRISCLSGYQNRRKFSAGLDCRKLSKHLCSTDVANEYCLIHTKGS